MSWTIEDLRKLDLKYAKEGVHMHQRPFRAATELLGPAFSIGVGGNPKVREITDAFKAMVPEARTSWPGMGIGLAVSVDQVRKAVASVTFGTFQGPPEVWKPLGFQTEKDWWLWCREDQDIAAESCFALADLYDFTYGVHDLRASRPEAQTLWRMAGSNLGDVANALPSQFSVDSLIQPICMVGELSLKAALVLNGAHPDEFARPNGERHDLSKLAERLSLESPHRDDPLVQTVVNKLPHYSNSRYAPAGLTRFQVVRLALGVQFVAASTVRRMSQRDLTAQMDVGGWPAPRRPFFD